MSESEVIRRLKEHIRACIIKHGRILKTDKGYIVKYIKDFLPWLSKEETESFFREKLLPVKVESDKFDVTYEVFSNGVIVNAGEYGKLAINRENLSGFMQELKSAAEIL